MDLETERVRLEEQTGLANEVYENAQAELGQDQGSLDQYQQKKDLAKKNLDEKRAQMGALEEEAAQAQDKLNQFLNEQIRMRSQQSDRSTRLQIIKGQNSLLRRKGKNS